VLFEPGLGVSENVLQWKPSLREALTLL
jgi:hypothetical protein